MYISEENYQRFLDIIEGQNKQIENLIELCHRYAKQSKEAKLMYCELFEAVDGTGKIDFSDETREQMKILRNSIESVEL